MSISDIHIFGVPPGFAPLLASHGCASKIAHPSMLGIASSALSQLTMGESEGHLSGNLVTGTSSFDLVGVIIRQMGWWASGHSVLVLRWRFRSSVGAAHTRDVLGFDHERAVGIDAAGSFRDCDVRGRL
jgi:hypothetical protein